MAVPVQLAPVFKAGIPETLFQDNFTASGSITPTYDVAPDGRFLMLEPVEKAPSTKIVVVTNWFEELKRLVPVH